MHISTLTISEIQRISEYLTPLDLKLMSLVSSLFYYNIKSSSVCQYLLNQLKSNTYLPDNYSNFIMFLNIKYAKNINIIKQLQIPNINTRIGSIHMFSVRHNLFYDFYDEYFNWCVKYGLRHKSRLLSKPVLNGLEKHVHSEILLCFKNAKYVDFRLMLNNIKLPQPPIQKIEQ